MDLKLDGKVAKRQKTKEEILEAKVAALEAKADKHETDIAAMKKTPK